jgi:hypothetical protein
MAHGLPRSDYTACMGIALSARPQYEASLLTNVTFPVITRNMTNYQRLWAQVVLQAVAEQLSEFVTTNKTGLEGQRLRERESKKARDYVMGIGFAHDCDCAGLPVEMMRKMLPSTANEAMKRLVCDASPMQLIEDVEEDMA